MTWSRCEWGGHEFSIIGSGMDGGGVGPVADVGVHGSGCGGFIKRNDFR